MAEKRKSQGRGIHSADAASLSLFDDLKKLAEAGLDKEFLTYDELLFKLRRWWCQYYKRPYKDPLLDEYTFEELAFEYFDINAPRKTTDEAVAEKVEEEDRDWAEQEALREEAEALAAEAEIARAHAAPESDIIAEEASELTDNEWAEKYDKPEKTMVNPSADQVDNEDGDISASFEV
jgi:hypothetical protein